MEDNNLISINLDALKSLIRREVITSLTVAEHIGEVARKAVKQVSVSEDDIHDVASEYLNDNIDSLIEDCDPHSTINDYIQYVLDNTSFDIDVSVG